MPTCLLGLGSNLGDSARLLSEAVARLKSHPHIEVLRQSRFRETSPVGGPAGQAAYLNAAAVVRTSLSPRELLTVCQEIENSLGRRREERWGPRTIDIDLLLYDDLVLNERDLQIPHPRMAWRRFVLEPAAEIAAEMVHPVIGWTVGHLRYHLNSTPWYLAIEGPSISHKHVLAAKVCDRLGARFLTNPFDLARNPSSHSLQLELEFLKKRARELDAADPAWASMNRPTISDFWSEAWFEHSVEHAKLRLPADEFADYMTVWTKSRWRVARPRLLAMLWIPHEGIYQIAEELRQRENSSGGPVLRTDATDQEAAIAELTAAVEAMR